MVGRFGDQDHGWFLGGKGRKRQPEVYHRRRGKMRGGWEAAKEKAHNLLHQVAPGGARYRRAGTPLFRAYRRNGRGRTLYT